MMLFCMISLVPGVEERKERALFPPSTPGIRLLCDIYFDGRFTWYCPWLQLSINSQGTLLLTACFYPLSGNWPFYCPVFGQDSSSTSQRAGTNVCVHNLHKVWSAPLFLLAIVQVDAQVVEQSSYGNGVESILVKEDPSLPLFVAIVW